MRCRTCAYFDDDIDFCTHPTVNTEIPATIIETGCLLHEQIKEKEQ